MRFFVYYITMSGIEEYGSDVLRAENKDVCIFNEDFVFLIAEMTQLMHKTNGVGLAGPQVGHSESFFITEAPGDQLRVFVNPKIISTSVEMVEMEEGCLSVPGIWGSISRAKKIVIDALDQSGKPFRLKADGYLARIIQHENDHLKGILFIDYLDKKTKDKVHKKFEKKLHVEEKRRKKLDAK